jgi:6-phosphogluconolactonase (cycloisomerase 2 family)
MRTLLGGALALALVSGGVAANAAPAHPDGAAAPSVAGTGKGGGKADGGSAGAGAVYVLTNAAAGNAVAVFDRATNGTLAAAGTVPTGGLGTDKGLGSQGALALSPDGHWLFAVNAGSNDISVLYAEGTGLKLVGRQPSGGTTPISLTLDHDLLYVLNAGSASITGFRVGLTGTLYPVAGSTRPLSGPATVGPAQVSFTPDGHTLVVTEKASNQIDTYKVGADGVASAPASFPSAGTTPFGFGFTPAGHLIVSDAFGGMAGKGAVSSYAVSANSDVATVTGVAPNGQTAPCWVAVSPDGRFAYTTNAGSGSVTGYSVDTSGRLGLLTADGRTGAMAANSRPLDLGFSQNGRYLYILTPGSASVSAFRVAADGSLAALPSVGGILNSAVGLAAR